MVRRYHLHAPGLAYAGLAILVGLAAISRQNNLLFWILGVMISALLTGGVVSGLMMQSLRVRRLAPGHGVVGEPLALRYALTNRSRFLPVFAIHVEEVPEDGWRRLMAPARAWVMHAGPRETVHGEAVFWPAARGRAKLHRLRLWTTFPFGIIKKSITITQPGYVPVYPRLHELRPDLLAEIDPQGLAGARLSGRTGPGDDYYGMREFRPGDSMRSIAWKRSACLEELVCVERTQPTPPRVRVVVNLTVPTSGLVRDGVTGTDARRDEEQAISLAASIVRAADRRGFEVGLSLPGVDRPPLLIRRGHWHRARIMSALADIDLDAPRAATPAAIPAAERAGQIVVHPAAVDPAVGREDAWHLTAKQLPALTARAAGRERGAPSAPEAPPAGVAAA